MKTLVITVLTVLSTLEVCAQATNKLDPTGPIGIGTLTPGAKVEIGFSGNPGPAATYFKIAGTDNQSSGNQQILFEFSDPNAHLFRIWRPAWSGVRSPIVFGNVDCTPSFTQLVLDANNGNVGIGTLTPLHKLDINGDAGVRSGSALRLYNSANSSSAALSYNGSELVIDKNVNIGAEIQINSTLNLKSGNTLRIYNPNNASYASIWFTGTSLVENWPLTLNDRLSIVGNVGIGTDAPATGDYKMLVNGSIRAKKIVVNTNWPDYVFDDAYKLRSLENLDSFIKRNKHLPGIPSAKDANEKGISVGENQALLLRKIEELTLYIIDLQKQVDELKKKR